MGTSINSQKKKNRNRSSARKTPMTPAKVHIRLKWKKPTRSVISLQEAITDMMPSPRVRRISNRLKPSRPR